MPTRTLSMTLAAVALVVVAAQPTSAWARHGDHHGHWRSGGHHHHGHHPGFHGRHGGHGGHWRSGRDVWAPLIVGGLIGAAVVGASQAHAQPAPATVFVPVPPSSHLTPAPVAPPLVVSPPVVVPPPPAPPRVHYYCAPYRAYFPQVPDCPMPWTLVPY